MANNHRTSHGRLVDMDKIRLSHEEVIAVGNMKVNARGDQLGAGGQIVSTRNQNMNDYYKLHTPTAEVEQSVQSANTGPVAVDHTQYVNDSADFVLEKEIATHISEQNNATASKPTKGKK